ncbi:MAG: DUF3226 domain-containing protein [Oscillospiraceae bacterium]|nr:DUF3226 domain-containing protein [Oscillospiraceae bacterium]
MSQSIILCEGNTDFSLLQIYMREVHNWNEDKSYQKDVIKIPGQKSRMFNRAGDYLTVMATGGCTRITEGLELVLDRIIQASPPFESAFNKIVIVTDNDEIDTVETFVSNIENKLKEKAVSFSSNLKNKKWLDCKVTTSVGIPLDFQLLVLVIPFEHQGAMETFLLDAISENDSYDKALVDKCRDFVKKADPEKRYLKHRSLITKAEFSSFFCIRTPADAYSERSSLLKKDITWSEYSVIRKEFEFLKKL